MEELTVFERPMWLAGLAAAVAVPYVATRDFQGSGDRARQRASRPVEAIAPPYESIASSSSVGTNPREPAFTGESTIDPVGWRDSTGDVPGVPSMPLPELIRFDAHPRWVNAMWPRVSTVLAENEMMGLRVPVATGTNPEDVSGALTYYFDREHRVQRITLDGVVGDERLLADFVGQVYGLRQEQALEAGVYVASQNKKIHSVMRVTFAPVLDVNQPLRQRAIWLELNRPGRDVKLSEETRQILDFERGSNRW